MSLGSFFAYCCLNGVNMCYFPNENDHNIEYLNQQVIILKIRILDGHSSKCLKLIVQSYISSDRLFMSKQTPNTVLFHEEIALHP